MRGVISIEFHQPIAILNYRFGCHTINPVVGSTADIPLHNRNNLGSTPCRWSGSTSSSEHTVTPKTGEKKLSSWNLLRWPETWRRGSAAINIRHIDRDP